MKIISALFQILLLATVLSAQEPIAKTETKTHSSARIHRVRKTPRTASQVPAKPATDFFISEARVDVTKDETVVRLAMAQHGSVLIELPANDGPRYIIPGDPEMATVDEKALELNKRAIVVRPGTQFLPPRPNAKTHSPAATVTAQMRSGLVVTFLFYPVEDLAQNVHRCVLNYNRDEVVARRRAAGLPVNLDDKEQGGEKTTAQPSAALTSTDSDKPKDNKPEESAPSERRLTPPVEAKTKEPSENNSELTASLRSGLKQAIKEPKRFKNWSRATHGLKLSVLKGQDAAKPISVLILAVKNTTNDPLTLVSDAPELFIETVDEKGSSLNLQSIAKTQTETSTTSAIIDARQTVYFVIAYASPLLDAHQRLKIVVAQTNAADEPASIKLAANSN